MATHSRIDQPGHAPSIGPKQSREHLGLVLKRAFPLPDSGAFADLLDAIGAEAPKRR